MTIAANNLHGDYQLANGYGHDRAKEVFKVQRYVANIFSLQISVIIHGPWIKHTSFCPLQYQYIFYFSFLLFFVALRKKFEFEQTTLFSYKRVSSRFVFCCSSTTQSQIRIR